MNQEWLQLGWGHTVDHKWSQRLGRLVQYHPIIVTTAYPFILLSCSARKVAAVLTTSLNNLWTELTTLSSQKAGTQQEQLALTKRICVPYPVGVLASGRQSFVWSSHVTVFTPLCSLRRTHYCHHSSGYIKLFNPSITKGQWRFQSIKSKLRLRSNWEQIKFGCAIPCISKTFVFPSHGWSCKNHVFVSNVCMLLLNPQLFLSPVAVCAIMIHLVVRGP
jgi:hypothetical protein